MPPLEFAPKSYYAERGSEEAKELMSRTTTGEFVVYSTNSMARGIDPGHLIFAHKGDESAVPAFCMEMGQDFIARLEYEPAKLGAMKKLLGKLSLSK